MFWIIYFPPLFPLAVISPETNRADARDPSTFYQAVITFQG